MSPFGLVVTEGLLEVPATKKILECLTVDYGVTAFVPKGGRNAFWNDVGRYNTAARYAGPILGLADLEQHACPSGLIAEHLSQGHQKSFVLRVAVRMLEAWLIADRSAIAKFLGISVTKIPKDPDELPNPKQTLVNLARQSRRTEIVADLVPSRGSSGIVGRGYTARMTSYVQTAWRPLEARQCSPSLSRALNAIEAASA